MKIKLLGLTEGEHLYDEEILPADLELKQQEFAHPIHVSARIDKRGGNYYIKISTSVVGIFQCDRCLDEFEQELTGEVALVYSENEELFAEGEDEDLRLVSKSGSEIDLAGDVRDAVFLTIPIKHVCSEDCRGLCPECGANKNHVSCSCSVESADSRWDALRKLGF